MTSSDMGATGAQPEIQPASYQVGGLPAFRYNLPKFPIATATVSTPDVTIELSLSLKGSVTLTFPDAPPGISTDVDTGGWRIQAQQALGPLTQGMRVSGIGTDKPSIGVISGTRFTTTETRFEPPNTMLYICQGRVDYTVPSRNLGPIRVRGDAQGQVGAELRITVIPHPQEPAPVPERAPEIRDHRSWLDAFGVALVGAGVIALIVVAPEAAPVLVLAI